MTVDFDPEPKAKDIAARTSEYIRTTVIPVEEEYRGVLHGAPNSLRKLLQESAKAAGVFAPQVSASWGGLGLDMRGQALVFEEAGYSLFGPLAINAAAPDEGNMHLIDIVGDEEQKSRYLGALARGEMRSSFAMTEPAPGAGSDPSLLLTTAHRFGAGWRIDGRKWFITGANGAGVFICMARTDDLTGNCGNPTATMFLVDADSPGVRVVRDVESIDEGMFGGHGEVVFEDCVVGTDAVLGEVNRGFEYAQARLGPARLTHCMRWLGLARRARDIAIERVASREAFGSRLADLGLTQGLLAETEVDLAAARGLILHAAWRLDRGERAAQEVSIAKVFVSEAVGRIVDRSVQVCGALGVSRDILLSRYLQEVRPFRIYDGPSETHRWSIARRVVRNYERDSRVDK